MVRIGYRFYSETGKKIDEENKSFIGWKSKYDEDLCVMSARIAKPNTKAKKLDLITNINTDPIVDDSNDDIFEGEDFM